MQIEPAPRKQVGLRLEDSDSEDNNIDFERKKEEKKRKRLEVKRAKLDRKPVTSSRIPDRSEQDQQDI
jgi:hypothetical protein